ncbi:MAG TPA: hypothetical protein V6D22_10695 [Candidatus Obscuribacterales bacterium]
MKETSSRVNARPIKDVFDLNDLVNDLWHAFPKRKDRRMLDKFIEILHPRLCTQTDPNCFLCQHSWNQEMVNTRLSVEAEVVPLFPADRPVGIALNRMINEHMRQTHYGLPVTYRPEDLWKIWDIDVCVGDDVQDSMFGIVRQMQELIDDLPPKEQSKLLANGWQPMFQTLH